MTKLRIYASTYWISLCLLFIVVISGPDIGLCENENLDILYEKFKNKTGNALLEVPLVVETHEEKSHSRCCVYGLIEEDFIKFKEVLSKTENWCDILLLHPNTKACIVSRKNHQEALTLYSGRKYYAPPEEGIQLVLNFSVKENTARLLDIRLAGEKGPLNTENYEIRIKAIPVDTGQTFLVLNYGYDYGLAFKVALKSYLATIGRRKVGFTVIGNEKNGEPIYAGGSQGLIERNSVRYFFSIHAYLKTMDFSKDTRFEKSISLYYDFVNQYPKQLYELDKNDYTANKIKEYNNQLKLQKTVTPLRFP
jgi:hypothetical protein